MRSVCAVLGRRELRVVLDAVHLHSRFLECLVAVFQEDRTGYCDLLPVTCEIICAAVWMVTCADLGLMAPINWGP